VETGPPNRPRPSRYACNREGVASMNLPLKIGVVVAAATAVFGSSAFPASADPLFVFTPRVDYSTGDQPEAVVATDLNGDGVPDLVTADRYEQALSIFLGTGGGAFGPRKRWDLGGQPTSVAAADFDGDGHSDIAVSTYEGAVLVLHGNGSGTFAAPESTSVSPHAESMAVGDLNGDGHPDAVLSRPTGITVVLAGSDGSFSTGTDIASGGYSRSVVLQDFDQNGALDIAVSSFGASDGIAWIFYGNGDGTFTPYILHGDPGNRIDIAAGDFDTDSYPDLMVANYTTGAVAHSAYRTEGAAFFRLPYEGEPLSLSLFSVNLTDLDGDRWVDLITTVPTEDHIVVYRQYPTYASLWRTTPMPIATGNVPVRVYTTDLDGDGLKDLVVLNRAGKSMSVFLNRTPQRPPGSVQI
jgi:hypothetical protein